MLNLHREIYELKPDRKQLPASLQCYYVADDADHAHRQRLAPPPGTPPPAFDACQRFDDHDEGEGELTSVKVDNQSMTWDHEIYIPEDTDSHVVDLAAVHY